MNDPNIPRAKLDKLVEAAVAVQSSNHIQSTLINMLFAAIQEIDPDAVARVREIQELLLRSIPRDESDP
jgi:hypothetical protein